jgi:hypothetical protein
MATRYRMALLVAAYLAAGCKYGMTADKFIPAHTPGGIALHLLGGNVPLTGELIEVRDDALVILTGKILRLVPYTVVTSLKADQTDMAISGGRPLSGVDRERLRSWSRFPQGLGPDLLNPLLRGYGQTQLVGPFG